MRTRLPGWSTLQPRTLAAAGLLILLLALQACGDSNGNYKTYGGPGPNGGGINSNTRFTGKIIFVKNRNIFVLDGKTNTPIQLTTGSDTLQPALSPTDKNTLVFQLRKPGSDYSNIATMPLQTGVAPTVLTDNAMHYPSPGNAPNNRYQFWANNPIWTADGQNIIYLTDFFKGGYATTPTIANPTCPGINDDFVIDMGIVEIPANAKPLPSVASNGKGNPPKQLAWPYCSAGGDQDLSLRPGVANTEILFTSFQYIPPQQSQLGAQLSLLIIPNDGSPERIVQLSPLDPNAVPLEPAWSPDGKYITYIRRENGQDNLYIMPIADATITGTPNTINGNTEIYNLQTGGKTAYYTNTGYYDKSQKLADGIYGNPVWGDSTHIVFMKFDTTDNGGTFNLFLAKLKFATPAIGPSGTPTGTATTAPTAAVVSIDGPQAQLTKGGVDGESRPIWVQ